MPPPDFASIRWRLLHMAPRPGAANMGLDEALMARARETGECVLRTYAWSRPTLSLGRHQVARGRIDPARVRARGMDLVRRPTGGRALLHHREVTYSVTAPLGRDDSARAWYEAVNGVLLGALRELGVGAVPAVATGRTPIPGSASCFQRPDDGEIVVNGRKLVGSALWREGGALLQHGSILLEDDQALLVDLLPPGDGSAEPAATLHAALGRLPGADEVAGALASALMAAGARTAVPLVLDARLEAVAEAAAQRYASDDWTFRA
jgi:lipoate-protein ligase A